MLMSVAIMVELGNKPLISTAQSPGPVPTSRMRGSSLFSGGNGKVAVKQNKIKLMDDVQPGGFGLIIGHVIVLVTISSVILDNKGDALSLERLCRCSTIIVSL